MKFSVETWSVYRNYPHEDQHDQGKKEHTIKDTDVTATEALKEITGNMISKGSHNQSDPTSNNHQNIGKEGTQIERAITINIITNDDSSENMVCVIATRALLKTTGT